MKFSCYIILQSCPSIILHCIQVKKHQSTTNDIHVHFNNDFAFKKNSLKILDIFYRKNSTNNVIKSHHIKYQMHSNINISHTNFNLVTKSYHQEQP